MTNGCLIKGSQGYDHRIAFERLLKKISLCYRANNFVMPEKCRKRNSKHYHQLLKRLSEDFPSDYLAANRDGSIRNITHPYLYAGEDNGEEPQTAETSGSKKPSFLEVSV